jgi:hypothetical protein
MAQTHLTFGKEFASAIEKKQVAQQEAEKQRFVVAKVCLCIFACLYARLYMRTAAGAEKQRFAVAKLYACMFAYVCFMHTYAHPE